MTASLLVAGLWALFACAPANDFPAIDETGNESASVVEPPSVVLPDPVAPEVPAVTGQKLLLSQAMTLRYEKSGVLENKIELPEGTQIEIPSSYDVKHLDYRTSNGGIERSSTGFIYPVKVVSVLPQYQSQFSAAKIAEINKTSGGLFIFASIVGSLQGTEGNFAVVTASALGEGFVKNFETNGKPKFKYTSSVTKKFGDRLNKGVRPEGMSSEARAKYQAIFDELRKAVSRTVATPKSYLMMDKTAATQWSINSEKTGVISTSGAWSIATQARPFAMVFPMFPVPSFSRNFCVRLISARAIV